MLQSTQRNRNLYTRGEAVWSLFDGKFKNYFGVNYTNQWDWTFDPNADISISLRRSVAPPITNLGERTKYRLARRGKVMPGQTLVARPGAADRPAAHRFDRNGSMPFSITRRRRPRRRPGNKAGYIELQSEFAKRFFLVANIRYDDNDSFGPHTTWRIAPAFIVPGTDTKLKGSYGTGFKAPTLTQLYVNNPSSSAPSPIPTCSRKPAQGYDVGFEQPLWHGRVNFGVTYFHNKIKNLIDNTFDTTTFTFTYVNIGAATTVRHRILRLRCRQRCN